MRYPKSIKRGDTIGIIAPSFGGSSSPFKDRLDRSLEKLKNEGFKLEIGPNAFAGKGLGKSNTPEACADELMDFFTNRKVDAILSAGGGETMCEDLKFVDFEKLAAADPKWFCGYSDNTNLTFTLATHCDTASIYGPCAGHFWSEPIGTKASDSLYGNFGQPECETLEIMSGVRNVVENHGFWEKDAAESDDPFRTADLAEPFGMRILLPGASPDDLAPDGKNIRFEGRLIGGCLDCLQVLAGTPYAGTDKFIKRYRDEGIIWFMEACDLNPMSIRRAVWQLREAGWFEGVRGFLIGRPLHYGEEILGMDQYNAVTGVLAELNVPILMDLDIGHTEQMIPLVTGSYAVVETKGNAVSINQIYK